MPLVMGVRRIMGYRWCDSYQTSDCCVKLIRRLLPGQSVNTNSLYGHVARCPEADPAHRVVSVRDNPEWKRPRGRSQSSWLEEVDRS